MLEDLEISSVEAAVGVIRWLESADSEEFSEQDYENIKISGEIAALRITVEGPNFKGTVTGGLARGLWHLQKEIYQAAASAMFNTDNYGRIPRGELKDYTLVFEVKEGSSDLWAEVTKVAKHVVDKTMQGMTPREKAALLIKLVLGATGIFAAAYVAANAGTDYFDYRRKAVEAEYNAQTAASHDDVEKARIAAEVQREEAQAKLIKAVTASDPVSRRFDAAVQEGTKAIIKYTPDATSLTVGKSRLNQEQLAEVNQRAAREVPDIFNIFGYYRVTSTTEPTSEGVVRVGLSGNGEEFVAYLNLADQEHPISEAQSDAVFLAPKTGKRLYMNVRMKRTGDGIKVATIEGFPADPEQHAAIGADPPETPAVPHEPIWMAKSLPKSEDWSEPPRISLPWKE